MIAKFTQQNFHRLCDEVAGLDDDLAAIIHAHGYAPMWTRPNTFETLVHLYLSSPVRGWD
jgi:DNA-3-methyladenine glycosylase II